MTRLTQKLLQITLAAIAVVGCLSITEKVSLPASHSLVSTAEARIGRPLTPLSYAGVARRTTRRAVAAGAAVGAAAAYPRCVQAGDGLWASRNVVMRLIRGARERALPRTRAQLMMLMSA
jgi:hypothetical protein